MTVLPAITSPAAALAAAHRDLGMEICSGLGADGQKTLPSRLLYDDVGSALFEVISLLPEYGLTRADERILRAHAADIVSRVPRPLRVVELGSGSGRKTRWILGEAASRQRVSYHPIDLSRAALESCHACLVDTRGVRVEPIEAPYLLGLHVATARRRTGEHLFVLFLGSTIGNFVPQAAQGFLSEVRRLLVPGDALLLGTDLSKPVARLLAAYDDPLGVTAAFDLNTLSRINHEFQADFDLNRFRHQARWNEPERDVEMHLVAREAHAVEIRALNLRVAFRSGESIWTESSHKYEPDEPQRLGHGAGFECAGQWLDREWPFAETLLIAR